MDTLLIYGVCYDNLHMCYVPMYMVFAGVIDVYICICDELQGCLNKQTKNNTYWTLCRVLHSAIRCKASVALGLKDTWQNMGRVTRIALHIIDVSSVGIRLTVYAERASMTLDS